MFYEYDMGRFLFEEFGVHITRPESTRSEMHFSDIIRCTIEREPGVLGMGGKKFIAFHVDYCDAIRFDAMIMANSIKRELLIVIRGVYWTDYLMNMWGYPKKCH